MATHDTHSLAPTGDLTDTGTQHNLKDKMASAASHAKHTAAEWGRTAAHKVDQNLQSAAGALESTASRIRDRVPASGRVNEFGTAAAGKFESTARYLREHDTKDMVAGVESLIRRNPGPSLCAALTVGFLIGLAIKRDRDY